MRTNFTKFLKENKNVIGTFANTGNPEIMEIACQTGFQFIIIDCEHGSWSGATTSHLIRAIESFKGIPLVRVPNIDETAIKYALDSGAAGVVIPGISSPEEAARAVAWCKFAPDGRRGACPFVRANDYTGANSAYYKDANDNVAPILLIEGKSGLETFDRILEVPGVNNVFFGPHDLSVSLGIPGQVESARIVDAIKGMAKKANAKGVKCGMLGAGIADTKRWFECGIDYIAHVGDMALYHEACTAYVKGVRA